MKKPRHQDFQGGRKLLISLALVISSVQVAILQTPLFSYLDTEALTASQESKFIEYSEQRGIDTIYAVEFLELRTMQSRGIVNIETPHNPCLSLDFQAKQVEYLSDDEYVWHGNIFPFDSITDCGIGHLTLIHGNNAYYGGFEVGSTSFLIYDLGDGISAIAEVGNEYNGMECPGVISGGGQFQGGEEEPVTSRNPVNCFVNLLVLYQPETNIAGDIEYFVDTHVKLTNIALRNSGISTNQLRIFLVGLEEVDFTAINPTQGADDLDVLAANQDIVNLRNELGADIVIFITADDYSVGDDDILGVAMSNSSASDISSIDAYALVEEV